MNKIGSGPRNDALPLLGARFIYRAPPSASELAMTILTVGRLVRGADAVLHNDEDRVAASRITRYRHTIARWIARSRQRRTLRDIATDDHLLKDIGVSRPAAFREADKPFWWP